MRSELLIVARRDRLPRIEARGGIAARSTAPDTVHLVSAAATPLGGDVICLRIIAEPGARLRVRSAAAAVVLPGALTRSSHTEMALEVDGDLDVDLEPTVVAAAAAHRSAVTATLGAAGALRLRERVQVGRSGERDGYWSGSLHADAHGLPVLRHRVDLGAGAVGDDVIAAPRACISELRYPATEFSTATPEGMTVLQLAAGGVLATWQGAALPA